MKKLLFIGLLIIAIIGCKKEDATLKSPNTNRVLYEFSTGGEPSTITYTSIEEGKTVTTTNIVGTKLPNNSYSSSDIPDYVKPGDHVKLEMSCSKIVIGYEIAIYYIKPLGNSLTSSHFIIGNFSPVNQNGTYKVTLEYTFTEADFNK